MNSQLNPNAAVFIPVSPTRLLMMDEAIISASSGLNFEESPINLEYSRVPKHEDYFMRDNFSTIPNQSACSVADFTIRSSEEHMEHIPLDKLLAVQNNSRELEKANFFGITKVCIDKESDSTNISGKAVGFADKNVMEESALTGTTSSLKVEISCFTITEDVEPINNQTAVDVPVDDLVADKQASPDILSLKDEPLKGSKQKKKTRSNRYRFKRRPKKVEPHVDENSEGFVTEHRRSPPIDLTFKPIQTFGDANPFGALQTPTTTTPTDQTYNLAELYKTPQETPMKEGESGKSETNQSDIIMTTPPSFIMRRSPVDECLVPFEELESPNELPPFMHPPNANRSITDIELPKSPNTQDSNENMPSLKLEQVESKIDSGIKTGFNELAQDLSVNVANTEKQEISSVSENSQVNKTFSYVDAANAKKQGISSVSENSKVNKTLSYVDAASAKKQGISSVSKNSKVNKTLSYVDAANAKKQGISSVSENSKVDKTLTHVDAGIAKKQGISSVSEISKVDKTLSHVDDGIAKKQGISSVSEISKVDKTLSHVDDGIAKKQGISSVSEISKVDKTLSHVDDGIAKKQGISSVSENSQRNKTFANVDAANAKKHKTGSVSENSKVNKTLSYVDLDTNERFLRPEYTVSPKNKECEQAPKTDVDLKSDSNTIQPDDSNIYDTPTLKAEECTPPPPPPPLPPFGYKTTDDHCSFDIFSSIHSEHTESEIVSDQKTNIEQVMQDLFAEDSNPEMQETSFTNTHMNKQFIDSDFGSNKELMEEISKIMQYDKEFEQTSKIVEDVIIDIDTPQPENKVVSSTDVLKAVNQTHTEHDSTDSKIKAETTQMKLALDTHVPTSPTTPEELRNLVQGFEVIDKDELIKENYSPKEPEISIEPCEASLQIMGEKEDFVNVNSPPNETNLLKMDESFIADQSTSITQNDSVEDDDITNTDFFNAMDKLNEAENAKLDASEHSTLAEIPQIIVSECTESSSLGKEDSSCVSEEIIPEETDPLQNPVLAEENKQFVEKEVTTTPVDVKSTVDVENVQNDPAQNVIVTEKLTPSSEEANDIPFVKVPQTAGTVTTNVPLPGLEDSQKLQELPETDISLTVTEEIIPEETDPLQNPVLAEENKQFVEKEVTTTPVDVKSTVDVENVQNDPAQNVIVTEKLTPSSEEANNIPFVKVPQTAGTVTTNVPLPGLEDSQKLQELPETDISLTVTEAEADISDAIAEKEMEKEEEPVKVKKPVDETSTRPSDIQIKKPAKPSATTSAARPAAAKTPTSGTKPATGAKTTTSATTTGKSPTVKPTASSITSTKMASSGAASAKTATSSTTTSKTNASGVTASKPAATGPSKPAAANTVASKPAASSAPSSKSTTSSVSPSKSSASSVASSKPASSAVPAKSSSSSVAPSKSSASSVASSKPASSAVSAKSSSSSVAPSKSSGSTLTSYKTASTTVAPSKSAISSSTPLKSAVASSVSSKPASASKPAASSSTTVKPVSPSTTPTKPAASSTTATKPTATGTPTATSAAKPTGSKVTTPPSTKPSVTSTTPLKSVPTLLPGIEKTPTSLKFPSTPTTPTSNPTTPTTPKSPMEKQSTIKSPSRPETKSPLSAKTSVSSKPVKPSDKKPTTNKDVKLLGKKSEVPKSSTTATAKPSAPTKTGTSPAKPVGSATKSQTIAPNKTTASKPAAATTLKPKPEGASDAASNVSGSAGAKKSAAAPGTKIPDKTGKEPASGKLAANGKPASAKTSSSVKIDPKGNTKNPDKSAVGKKCEEEKKEKSVKVQEHKVSTTNEFTNHTSEPMMHVVTEVVN